MALSFVIFHSSPMSSSITQAALLFLYMEPPLRVPSTLPSPSSSSSSSSSGRKLMASHISSLVHATDSPARDHSRQGQNKNGVCHHSIDIISPPAAEAEPDSIDYSSRGQWLRAAVLGANDGLVSVASLMIGVGAVNQTSKAMLVSGLAGLVAGACSMAIGEFVSVYAQYEIEVAQMKRDEEGTGIEMGKEVRRRSLPSPFKAAAASAVAFAVGALLPLLAGGFVKALGVRIAVVCAVTSMGLAGFGAVGALLGGASIRKSSVRVLLGGWMAMAGCYGVLRLFGLAFGAEPETA
ncbi:vacuolar iron transporter [Canna indica]|uniref:Vacuolar iron transporter n=1 Tax=Canna indica TaxID=4628 RepID=A0AAQ3JTX8_9LILI|nr:vacuolar iron transporter [Canna indica]